MFKTFLNVLFEFIFRPSTLEINIFIVYFKRILYRSTEKKKKKQRSQIYYIILTFVQRVQIINEHNIQPLRDNFAEDVARISYVIVMSKKQLKY